MFEKSKILLLCCCLTLPAWSAAGPKEDFEEGAKAFNSGKVVDAIPPLKRAADAGNADAQVMLGQLLDGAEFDEDAVKYFRKAADLGNSEGAFGLGTMYASGEGVGQSFSEALKWLRKAAELGNKNAINFIAHAYMHGGLGFDDAARKSPEALNWIKRSAEADYVPALTALSAAYRSGQYGLAPDAAMADSLAARVTKLRTQTAAEAAVSEKSGK